MKFGEIGVQISQHQHPWLACSLLTQKKTAFKANPIWPPNANGLHLKYVLFLIWAQKEGPVTGQVFPRLFPLSDQSGKLKGTSEKPRGVPPIFLAPYFVKQKYVSPQQKCSLPRLEKKITNSLKIKLDRVSSYKIHTCCGSVRLDNL